MKKGIFCLEGMWERSMKIKTSVHPILELIQKKVGCDHIYHSCLTESEFLFCLKQWKKKSIQDRYPILYLGFHGQKECLELENKTITLNDLAIELQDSCKGKVFFFASCETLNTDERKIQTFLAKTGAIAAIGYKTEVDWMIAAAFELLVLHELQHDKFDSRGIKNIKATIETQFKGFKKELDFRIVPNKRLPFPRKRKQKVQ